VGSSYRLKNSPSKSLFCRVLLRNIEDFKRLGYDTRTLEKIYQSKCG